MSDTTRLNPARFRNLRGGDLIATLNDLVSDAQRGETRGLFTIGKINPVAAVMLVHRPSTLSLVASHGLTVPQVSLVLEGNGVKEWDIANSIEVIRQEGMTPNWPFAFHLAIQQKPAAQAMLDTGTAHLELKTPFLFNAPLIDVIYHGWEGSIRNDVKKLRREHTVAYS